MMDSSIIDYNNEILDLALNIDGFEHMEELLIAFNTSTQLMRFDTEMVLKGCQLILLALQHDITLQRHTLFATMLEVKRRYGVLHKFKHTASDMCAITLAINQVKHLLKVTKLKQQLFK
ncbi:hypothetical protein IQ781_21725 [Bacillus sp. N447-1]|uniref:hypothetical protein n=1 Tax=Bacillus TaxID=1386 RepID=UPI0005E2EAB3|nr:MULTISPECIES: hypothetical protein [Bacillus]CGF78011.1 Uncharacterised protein [Streptococcus pneumoniae]TNP09595.1 hypothetical protein FHY65_00885 [Bacillus cereus]UNT68060.1 hypothetical protein IQ781_21725 [Bacillus sp. N447-1]CIZ87120.1 Uncharacterised protein [Streptococcus pneumoniae]CJA13236.1 Uncharacterised protein [Streptococcus pneumoniae]